MNLLKALVFGIFGLILGCVVGLILWAVLGLPVDSNLPSVALTCNAVPILGLAFGVWLGSRPN